MMKEIRDYQDPSMFAKHLNDSDHNYGRLGFWNSLAANFKTNSDLLNSQYPELSELWKLCYNSCHEINNALSIQNLSPTSNDNVNGYAEDMSNLDYSRLLEYITQIKFEYFSSTPRDATDDEIREYYPNLSSEEQDQKVQAIKERIKLGKKIDEELSNLYAAVQKMKFEFSNIQVSEFKNGGKVTQAM